jgi:hypothetical protein
MSTRLLAKYEKAKQARTLFEPLFDECYEYALPMRKSFYFESVGQRRDDKIFDETAVVGVQEFASRLQSGLVPNFARWADFVAGSEIPDQNLDAVNNSLDEVTEYVFEVLQNSNFGQEIHESFMDLAVGTGVLLAEEGDAINPVRFNAIPLPSVVLDTGPDDKIDHVFRQREVKVTDIQVAYPKAVLSDKLQRQLNQSPDTKVKLLEVICRNYSKPNKEIHDFYVLDVEDKAVIYTERFEGAGSNPFICFRWSKAAGEVYGRGPLINALSAIKTTNLTIELILENAQMAISGIYQMDDDGVVNTDTINLVPGTIIPKAMGSQGLQPIRAAGDFNVANLVLGDMRNNIKRALYNDMLGDPNKTPATATEVAERMADLSRRIGSAFGRLQAEMVQPVLQRVVYILKKQGRIEIPSINGREVKVKSVSPLAQAQANQDISNVSRYLQLVGGTFGPEVLNILIRSDDVAAYLAKKFGVPDSLVRDKVEREQLLQAAQQYQQQMAQGNAPDVQALRS